MSLGYSHKIKMEDSHNNQYSISNEHNQKSSEENPKDKLHINDDSLILCKVCFTNRIDTIITPCYHACLCHDCWDKMPVPKVCPVCQGYVITTLHVIIDA